MALHLATHEISQEGIKLVTAVLVDRSPQRPHQGKEEGGLGGKEGRERIRREEWRRREERRG